MVWVNDPGDRSRYFAVLRMRHTVLTLLVPLCLFLHSAPAAPAPTYGPTFVDVLRGSHRRTNLTSHGICFGSLHPSHPSMQHTKARRKTKAQRFREPQCSQRSSPPRPAAPRHWKALEGRHAAATCQRVDGFIISLKRTRHGGTG